MISLVRIIKGSVQGSTLTANADKPLRADEMNLAGETAMLKTKASSKKVGKNLKFFKITSKPFDSQSTIFYTIYVY